MLDIYQKNFETYVVTHGSNDVDPNEIKEASRLAGEWAKNLEDECPEAGGCSVDVEKADLAPREGAPYRVNMFAVVCKASCQKVSMPSRNIKK